MVDDVKYLNFLKEIWNEYHEFYAERELNLFMHFMKKEDFLEWYKDVPQYQFDMGQEPDIDLIENFTLNSSDLPLDKTQKKNKLKELEMKSKEFLERRKEVTNSENSNNSSE